MKKILWRSNALTDFWITFARESFIIIASQVGINLLYADYSYKFWSTFC